MWKEDGNNRIKIKIKNQMVKNKMDGDKVKEIIFIIIGVENQEN